MTDARDLYKLFRELESQHQVNDTVGLHDSFDLELNEHFVIESGVVGLTEDGVIIQLDEEALEFLDFNGMLIESEELTESQLVNEEYRWRQEVADAIRRRILNNHHDIIGKFGPVRILAAIEDKAKDIGHVDEIGSSDTSIWTRQVIDDLEKGYYDNMDSVPIQRSMAEASPITHFSMNSDIFDKVVKSDYPFKVVYDGISGRFGEAARAKLQDMYDDVVIDNSEFHPDDDFEKIIDRVVTLIKADYGKGSSQTPDWYQSAMNKELHEIKKLALGQDENLHEVDGFGDIDAFKNMLSNSNDPFEMIYRAISGDFGDEIREEIEEMYNAVVSDSGYSLHPDDDFEKIIQVIVDQLSNDSADYRIDELSDIKRLAGQEEVDDDGYYAHREIHGSKGISKEDWKKGVRMNSKGQKVMAKEEIDEAEYQGRKVPLGKPMQGDVAKSKVYVKKPDGKVVKVNFGDKNMTIKKNNPERRKSFRARHRCENPGPRWKARYWSCRAW